MRFLFIFLVALKLTSTWCSPIEDRDTQRKSVFEESQAYLTSKLNGLANTLDSFFATERADDEFGRSRLRISQSYSIRERSRPEDQTRYRFNLKLPHLEEKFKFEYYADKGKSEKQLEDEKVRRDFERRNRIRSGWIFNADAGISIALPPNLVTRVRLRKNFDQGIFIHRFVESLTYITDQSGLIEETSLQSDLRLSEKLLFRFSNIKTWQIQNENFITKHGPALIHSLGEKDAISYDFTLTNEIIERVFFTSAYTLSLNYRRNLYKNVAFLDIVPGIDFPKVWSFRRTPFTLLRIEVLFGG
jgi:hypothetical protein